MHTNKQKEDKQIFRKGVMIKKKTIEHKDK
jgi:hypothetical protein